MTYTNKLKKLQKITEKTQSELAQMLGVSFPTLNSWIGGKSEPRKKSQDLIDLLYQEYTGTASVDGSQLEQKKQRIKDLQKQFPNPLKYIVSRPDIYNNLVLELTYHTNSIEGSTLNEPQVRSVLFDGLTIPDKTLVEHQEVKNHQAVLGNMFQWLSDKNTKIEEDYIQKLHWILMNGIWPNAGIYRNHGVRITGSQVTTANYVKISELMQDFIENLNTPCQNIISHLAKTHAQFEKIHPFSDGNGRVGRLIMHLVALRNNLPPLLIKKEKKYAYYSHLQKAQLKEEFIWLESFLYDAAIESYELFT